MSLRILSIVWVSFSTRSHLFTTMMLALPASWARPAILVSCSVTPSRASIMMRHTSARSMASCARMTENFSMRSSTLDLRRMPAVSMKIYLPYLFSRRVSTASRVVPAISATMTRFSPSTRLTSEDLPTFGLPMTATRMRSSSSSPSSSGGKFSMHASSISSVPWPWMAESAIGSPRPSE